MCSASGILWAAGREGNLICPPFDMPHLVIYWTSSYIIRSNHIHIIHRKSNHPIICTDIIPSSLYFRCVTYVFYCSLNCLQWEIHILSNQYLRRDRPRSTFSRFYFDFRGYSARLRTIEKRPLVRENTVYRRGKHKKITRSIRCCNVYTWMGMIAKCEKSDPVSGAWEACRNPNWAYR